MKSAAFCSAIFAGSLVALSARAGGGPLAPGPDGGAAAEYHPETRARVGPIVAGAVMFGVTYSVGVIGAIGANAGRNSYFDAMYVPVVGPFITAGQAFASAQKDGMWGSFDNGVGGLLVMDGIVQAAGIVCFVAGVAHPKTVLVRDVPRVRVAPVVSRSMTGLALSMSL